MGWDLNALWLLPVFKCFFPQAYCGQHAKRYFLFSGLVTAISVINALAIIFVITVINFICNEKPQHTKQPRRLAL